MDNKINFCVPELMSECSAKDPKSCKYYKTSHSHSRCLFQSLKLSDCYHCGCSDAQCDARNEKNNLLESIEELKEGDLPT